MSQELECAYTLACFTCLAVQKPDLQRACVLFVYGLHFQTSPCYILLSLVDTCQNITLLRPTFYQWEIWKSNVCNACSVLDLETQICLGQVKVLPWIIAFSMNGSFSVPECNAATFRVTSPQSQTLPSVHSLIGSLAMLTHIPMSQSHKCVLWKLLKVIVVCRKWQMKDIWQCNRKWEIFL